MNLHCPKCLTSTSEDKIGERCHATPGCDGIIERRPEWSELVDRLPEPMTCSRRVDEWGPWEHAPNLDYWEQFKAEHRHRVCSFCGSLHFDDFHKLCELAAAQPEDGDWCETVNVEISDKKYKVYVTVPGIRNAHQGGIKFYMWHCPKDADGKIAVSDEQNKTFKEAVRRSSKRFDKYLAVSR